MPEFPQRKLGFYYIDIDGETIELPSVTTILKVIDRPALMKWAARMAAKAVLLDPKKYDTPERAAAAVFEIGGSAAERGSDAHRIAEQYAQEYQQGIEPTVLDHPFFASIQSFFNTLRPTVIHIETLVVNTKIGYAGTLDLIAEIGGKKYVVDWKSSKFVYPEYPLQVEAYRQCDLAILRDGTRFQSNGPLADATAVVLLRPDGTFEWNECKGDFTAFLAAKILYDWKRTLHGNGI